MKKLLLSLSFIVLTIITNAHWQQTILNTPDVYAIEICENNIFAATNQGIYISTDNGINWTLVNSLSNVMTFATIGNYIFAGTGGYGGGGTGIYMSSDNGSNWTPVNNGLFYNYMGADHIPNVFALTVKGTTIFAGTMENGIYISTDSGLNWSPVNTGLFHKNVQVLTVNGNNVFAGTYNGGVYLSTNNGNYWTAVNSGISNFDIVSFTVNGNYIFAGTGSPGGIGQVFRSSDNGNSWTTVNNGLPTGSFANFDALASYGSNVFTTRTYVYVTSNYGAIWTGMNDGLSSSGLNIISFKIKGDTLFAGTYFNGLWYYPLSEFTEINENNKHENTITVYPNPSKDNLVVESLHKLFFQILNTQGQIIMQKQLQEGKTDIDIRALSAGLYILKITSNNKTEIRKFVKE